MDLLVAARMCSRRSPASTSSRRRLTSSSRRRPHPSIVQISAESRCASSPSDARSMRSHISLSVSARRASSLTLGMRTSRKVDSPLS